MKILLVGGAGFIGSVLGRKLAAAGHQVTTFDIADPSHGGSGEYIRGDVRDATALDAALRGQDMVINLAAAHRDDVRPLSLYESVNVDGAKSLVGAMRRNGVRRLIFTSSVAVYGDQDRPMTEDTSHDFFNEYGRTKHLAEEVYLDWFDGVRDASLVIIRPTVVFGPGNRGNVYNLLRQVKSGRFVMVGRGLNKKSMAHVQNIAAFIVHMTSAGPGIGVYNYADKPDLTMAELVDFIEATLGRSHRMRPRLPAAVGLALGRCADLVARVTGAELPVSSVRVRKFMMSSEVDAGRAFSTGFSPEVALLDGLSEVVRRHV